MKAKELIENNSLTNIEVIGGQKVVFTEIALTAVNMAREEGANNLIEQAVANGQKKHLEGMDYMKHKAIEAHRKCCPNLSKDYDQMCKHLTDCNRQCLYMTEFINQL